MRWGLIFALALLATSSHAQNWVTAPVGKPVPAWVSSTLPGSTNQILYNNGGALGAVPTGNSCVYLTNAAGAPGCSASPTVSNATGGAGFSAISTFAGGQAVLSLYDTTASSVGITIGSSHGGTFATIATANNAGVYQASALNFDLTGNVYLPVAATAAGSGYVCRTSSNGQLTVSTTTCGSSGKRFKIDLGPVASHDLGPLHPVAYRWRDPKEYDAATHVGLYADDVAKLDPRCAIYEGGEIKNYEDRCVIAYLVAALKHQQAEIDQLKAR